jgi:hypothetical protein
MNVTIYTAAYREAYGKAPRGRGHWFFEGGNLDSHGTRIVFHRHYDTYGLWTEAKRKAIKIARSYGCEYLILRASALDADEYLPT